MDMCNEEIDCSIESVVKKIQSKQDFLSLEINPALSAKIEQNAIKELEKDCNIDAFVVTDSPLARFKPSSILTSLKIQNLLQKPVICTLSMRDRNSLALCGDILAVNELGVRMFLTLTGDCIKNGDCNNAKSVFEDNSLKLADIIDNLNKGIAINGKELKEKVNKIYNFAVINSYANNPKSITNKIRKKLRSYNISALFTQPVYCTESAKTLIQGIEDSNKELGTKSTIVFGFFPVLSYKTALFLRDKLPGVYIPTSWVEKLESASLHNKEEEQKVGLELSLNIFTELKKIHNKFHLMSNKPTIFKSLI